MQKRENITPSKSSDEKLPVMLLSDGYIANGAEPWKFPQSADLQAIEVKFKEGLAEGEEKFMGAHGHHAEQHAGRQG